MPQELSRVNLNAAGIDVGASGHFVAASEGRSERPVREFEAYTAELYRMADWLVECGVETVVRGTGGVWAGGAAGGPPASQDRHAGLSVATAVHTYGLLSGAFRPETEIRSLRSYMRQRAMLVEYASHHIQHMQKALTQMSIKPQRVMSNITAKTGMRIIEAIVRGERDPRELARFRHPTMKADEKEIAMSLRGHWRAERIFELTQDLELYREYQRKIEECDRQIELRLGRFDDRSDGGALANRRGANPRQGNAPRFDVRTHLYRMTGVDLTEIDAGVEAYTARCGWG